MQIIFKKKEPVEYTLGRISAQLEIADKDIRKKVDNTNIRVSGVDSTTGDNAGGIDDLAELVSELIEAVDDLASVVSDIMEG